MNVNYSTLGHFEKRKLLAIHQRPQPDQRQQQLQQQRVVGTNVRGLPQRHIARAQPAARSRGSLLAAPPSHPGGARPHERGLARFLPLHYGARHSGIFFTFYNAQGSFGPLN